ncbi:MAG: ammonium transporter [Chloroflexi bacterium]|nr:ammonium transporter [Chloroflexota bacterium]MCH8349371.1 ammonium transporter [Chloroflexota bacterium]MCI0780034.1 ammonium transporter [Chloroflexota bacterium]MCI0786682.1 ammonium transporter [Chloroflexota bacterium]MCI0792290.1 ammonium transporter [Chloroflexota bacterium]
MFTKDLILSPNAQRLRRILPFAIAGLLAAGFLAGYNVAFAQEITAEDKLGKQGANTIWMFGAFLVFFMQAGFAFLGAGLIRAKNTTNYMTKSFMDFSIASLSFWAFGFALMWGTSAAGIVGTTNFFLLDGGAGQTYVDWVFQMVFAATAATIVAGAIAERTKTQAYLAYSFMIGAIIYPLYGHWVWGGGWLGSLEGIGLPAAADYAGSGVVHAVGGFVALAAAAVVGPRIGKFNADGSANLISGHSVPFVIIGTFILFFGWFGFNINPGDSLGLNAMNTLMAGATGATVALYIQLMRTGKTDILMACNGALAGLVGITAPSGYVEPWSAVVIGAVAAPVMMGSVMFIERVLKIDDPVSAISVHGTTGLWGLLAVGIFANGNNGVEGLVAGNVLQIVSQLISMGVVLAWGLATGFALFLMLKVTMGVRVTREEELVGLDISEHGLPAYPAEVQPAGAAGD